MTALTKQPGAEESAAIPGAVRSMIWSGRLLPKNITNTVTACCVYCTGVELGLYSREEHWPCVFEDRVLRDVWAEQETAEKCNQRFSDTHCS